MTVTVPSRMKINPPRIERTERMLCLSVFTVTVTVTDYLLTPFVSSLHSLPLQQYDLVPLDLQLVFFSPRFLVIALGFC